MHTQVLQASLTCRILGPIWLGTPYGFAYPNEIYRSQPIGNQIEGTKPNLLSLEVKTTGYLQGTEGPLKKQSNPPLDGHTNRLLSSPIGCEQAAWEVRGKVQP